MPPRPAQETVRCPHCTTVFALLKDGQLYPVDTARLLYGDTLWSPGLPLGHPLSARISLDFGACRICTAHFAYITVRGVLAELDDKDDERLFFPTESEFPEGGAFNDWTDPQGLPWLVHGAVLPVGALLTFVSFPFVISPRASEHRPPWKWSLSALHVHATVRAMQIWPVFLWQLWLFSQKARLPPAAFAHAVQDAFLQRPLFPRPDQTAPAPRDQGDSHAECFKTAARPHPSVGTAPPRGLPD